MREVPPCTITECTEFPALPFPVSITSDVHNTFGHVSKDGSWAWLAHKSVLEIFSTKTKERCGVWYCGASSKNDSVVITAIEELCSSYLPFPCLVVGLEGPEGGLINLFNVKTSKVINSIKIPNKVTSLAVISGAGGATMETHPLSPQLRFFFGIVAVGTEGGNVLLLDLCLDGENYTDENKPNKTLIVHKRTHNFPEKRELAIANSRHLCIFLNDTNFKLDVFEYRNIRTLIATLPVEDVIVTSVKYLRNLAVLAVGFNFGGMQLWNLQHLRLDFSLPVYLNLPLVHFAFQEPENDPRNFCYLWAIRGYYQGEHFKPRAKTVATLYCFAYSKKDWIPRYGYLYQNLETVNKSIEYTLSKDPYNCSSEPATSSSRLISCEIIPQPALKLEAEDSMQNDECGFAEDLSLCAMVWENWSGAKPSSSCFVLFDINQWYHAQVPSSIRCNFGTLCSYLGVFGLNEISSKMHMDPLMAISIVPNSLNRFKSCSMSEEMFFPSSFSFKIWCLSSANFLQATYLGIQRQILLEMNTSGPSILIEPKKLYDLCSAGGLINSLNDTPTSSQLTQSLQREVLLTLALENNMVYFLDQCVQSCQDTGFMMHGCSSKFLLDWIWKTVTKIKTSIDKLCLPLFNCSGQILDENNLLTLRTYESRLKHLSDLLLLFQHLLGPRTELGQRELQLKKGVVNTIATYLHISIWFCDCKLLPEHEEGCEYGEDEVAYPRSCFQKTYAYRRTELQKIHSSIGMTDLLMIDGLVNEFGPFLPQMWEKKGGTNMYPPPSIYAAISTYLLDGPSLSQKHLLTFYLLMDMTAFLADRHAHLLEMICSFGSSNNIPLHLCKLAQAFWHLDHCDFEMALTNFLDPMVLAADISSEQHVRILKSFLFQGQPKKALTYINTRRPIGASKEEIKLHLSILLANGLISEALSYQRKYQGEEESEDLLKHFFLGCQQTHNLYDVLLLPLNTVEYKFLSEYLLDCADSRAPEILVMYNLLRGNPLEAAEMNEKLVVSQMMERNFRSRERAASRNALVNGFVDALPEEQKKLAQELNQIYSQLKRKEDNPKPLSTKITSKSLNYISYADLLCDIICRHQEESHANYEEPSPLKTSKTLIQNTPFICSPFVKKRESRKRPSDVTFAIPASKKSTMCTENFVTPSKKSYGSKVAPFKLLDTTDFGGVKASLSNEISSLLQTPPVCRVQPKSKRLEEDLSFRVPSHSILKTKSSVEPVPDLSHDDHLRARTPSICSVSENEDEMRDNVHVTRKDQGDDRDLRQLRFKVPSPENVKPQYQPVSNLSRKPLHNESVLPKSSQKSGFTVESNLLSHLAPERSHEPNPLSEDKDKVLSDDGSEDSFFLHLSDSEPENEKQSDHDSTSDVDVVSVPKTVSDTNSLLGTEIYPKRSEVINKGSGFTDTLPAKVCQQTQSIIDSHCADIDTDSSESSLKLKSYSHSVLSTHGLIKPVEDSGVKNKNGSQPDQTVPIQNADVAESIDALSKKSVFEEKPKQEEKEPYPTSIAEVELNTSPYMGTRSRSRSKSTSPSRSRLSRSPLHSHAQPLLHKSIQEDSKAKSEKSVSEERSSKKRDPSPTVIDEPASPYLGTRSRSKSLSPFRTKTAKQSSVKFSVNPIEEEPNVQYIDESSKSRSSEPAVPRNLTTGDEFKKSSIIPKSSLLDDARKMLVSSVSSCLSSEVVTETKTYDFLPSQTASIASSSRSNVETETPKSITDIKKIGGSSTVSISEESQSHTKNEADIKVTIGKSEKSQQRKPLTASKKKSSATRGKGSTVKKETAASRVAQKLEFSFSEPHSSANAKILEALAKSPPTPVAPFIFSPPSTRARVRQKRLNETLNTSIASLGTSTDNMIVDPLLYEEPDEFAPPLPPPPDVPSSQSRKKSASAKKHIRSTQQYTPRSNIRSSDIGTASSKNSSQIATRLSNRKSTMALRNSTTKKKSSNSFGNASITK